MAMEDQIIEMIMDSHRDLKGDVTKLEKKVDEILEWKWKVVGGAIAVSGLLTIIFQSLTKLK